MVNGNFFESTSVIQADLKTVLFFFISSHSRLDDFMLLKPKNLFKETEINERNPGERKTLFSGYFYSKTRLQGTE